MARNLADMLDTRDLMALGLLAWSKPQESGLAKAYGISPDRDGCVPSDELRDILREAFAKDGRDHVLPLIKGHSLPPEVERIARVYGVDPVDLRAISIWRDGGFGVALAPDIDLTLFARREDARIGTSIEMGTNREVRWFPDEQDALHGMEITGVTPPQTTAIALIGKGIEAVFRHAATDDAGLIITDASVSPGRRSLQLQLRRGEPDHTEQGRAA